jgi:hypothetical protein
MAVPKGVEWYLHLSLCGTFLGPRTFWNTWKWNCRWARKRGLRLLFCWTGAGLGGLEAEYKEENSVLVDKQHMTLWQGLDGTQRQARELISGPRTAAKIRLLSFNRTQSREVIDLLTRHNTLSRHLPIIGLRDSPLYRKCGAEEETSADVLYECEALATHRLTYLGSFFLDPEDIRGLSLGGRSGTLLKEQGSHDLDFS